VTRAETEARTQEFLTALAAKNPDLGGRCSECDRDVTNADPDHRITPILEAGRGVECRWRGDYA
jgi:hypothetical protein